MDDFLVWLDARVFVGCLLALCGIGYFVREFIRDVKSYRETEALIDKLLSNMKADAAKRKARND